jgi:hypothetical protein
LGNTPDIQTLPFDKCLLLVEFLAGNQFLKGLLELSEGAAPPHTPAEHARTSQKYRRE